MSYITKIEDYWIAPSAVNISLNAMGDPNRIQGSVASGAVISCYIDGIPGLELDNGRNPKRWPLSLSPTLFNSFTEKYVYAAIPRSTEVGTMAVVVFPSELIYLDGTNEAGIQVGSEDYYYVWLQGIISATDGNIPRTLTAACDFGSLGTYEDIVSVKDVDWYSYDKLTQIVTFLKGIVMKPGSSFYNLILGGKELKGVATADTSAYYIDSDTLVATPGYLHANYLNKKAEDTAEEQIGFLKGLWIGVKGLYEITADGMGKFKSLVAESVNAQRVQADEMQSSNFTGDGISDTGWRLTNNHNGHSKLIVDELYVRMKAVFESLEVKKEMVTGGNQIFSRAANVVCRTDYFDANGDRIGYSDVKVPWLLRGLSMVLSKRILNGIYSRSKSVRVNISDASQIATIRCYFLAEEGGRKVNNLWSIEGGHDLARCQTFNLNRSERTSYVDGENVKLGNVFWWRKVVGVSSNSNPVEIDGKKYHYFDVSNQSGGYLAGSDLPCAGDEVSQWGNDGNEDRMHLVTIEVDGGVAIKAYEGIYTFDMSKCWYGGNPCKMNLSPQNEYRFTGRSFKIETEYGIRPVPVDIDVDWASQTKSRAEYAETGISVGQLIIKNYYYDRLPHNGSLWLCLFSGSTYWARYAKYDAGVISYVTEDVFNTLPDSQKLYVRVSGRTGLADNQVCRRMEYTSAEPGTNNAVWHQEVAKGQNGIDAQDVEWVYIRTKTNEAPVILSDSTYTDHNGHTYTADDHLPRVTGNANIENNEGVYECTDDPKGVDDTWKYEWEIKRSKGAASDGHRAWNYYQGAMTLHNNLAESAFIIDTDNDNDQFGTDSESIVLVTQTRQTVVSLYDGSTQQSLTNLTAALTFDDGTSVPSGVATVSANASTGVVEVTVLQNSTPINHSEIRAAITATCAKGSKQTTFSLRKMMGGAPGLNPIIYQLAPTVKAFPFARTSTNALTPNSQVSQINVSRTEGNTTTILTTAQTGITYQWGFDDSTTPEETNKSVGSTITVTKAQAALHSKVWIKLSTGDRETLPIVKDGAKGDPGNNGDTPVQAFQWNQSATTAPSPLPSGANLGDWSLTAPNRPSGDGEYFLWMTQTVKHVSVNGTVTYDTWSAAVRISGDNGGAGEDASDQEFVYIRLTTYPFPNNVTKPADATRGKVHGTGNWIPAADQYETDDWVPEGWSDTALPATENEKYVYAAIRKKSAGHDEDWDDFDEPFLWSNWGVQGIDGDGVQYVYKLFDHELTAAERESNIPTKPQSQTQGEWIPTGWSDDPLAPTVNMQYCYCSTIKKIGGSWADTFDTLGLWSRFSKDGQSAYKSTMFVRLNTTPTKPANNKGSYNNPSPSDCPAGTSGGSTVYWSDGIPSGEAQIWATSRIFTNDGTSPQQSSWSTPQPMSDTNTFDVEFAVMQTNDAIPATPTANNRHKNAYPYGYEGQVWFDPELDKYSAAGVLRDFTQMYWRAERECKNGDWGDWTIQRIKGENGDNGEDGVTLLISPASLIVNQDLNNPDNLSNLTQTFVVAVYKGTEPQTVNGISFTAETVPSSYPTAYKGLFLNNSSQRVGSGNVNGNILTLKQINTYTQGQQTLYYDNFYADLVVNYGNLKTISGRVRIYANLLGTWKQTIEGDVSTEMAAKIQYLYDPNNPDQVVKNSTYGEFVRSSTENMSKLSAKVDGGKNLLTGVLTGEEWQLLHNGTRTNIETNDEDKFVIPSGYYLESPERNYSLNDGYYALSYEASAHATIGFYDSDDNLIDVPRTRGYANGRRYIIFNTVWEDEGEEKSLDTDAVIRFSGVSYIRHPQLEIGNVATAFEAGSTETTSRIHQTAEQIEELVNDTGVNIVDKTISLYADKVKFYKNKSAAQQGDPAKIWIDGGDGSLHAVDGNFEGTVRATNFYQQMSVFYEGNSLQPSQYSYCKYYCTDAYDTFQQGHYYDPSVVPEQWYYNFIPCTYDAEVVNLIPNPTEQWNSGKNTCYLPDPKDFVGKVVHVYAPKIGSITSRPIMDCVVRLIDQNDRRFAKWIYLDGNRIKAQVLEPSDTVALGTEAIYQAIYADGDNKYYWLKLL